MSGEQRGDSMDSAPKCLANGFGVLGAKLFGGDTVKNAAPEKIEGLHARGIGMNILGFVHAFREDHHEGGAIMVWVRDTKVYVGD